MARQHGNSRRGPDDLDRAERNQGRSGSRRDSVSAGEVPAGEVPGPYASDFETQDTGQLLADGELVGPWSSGEDQGEAEGRLLAGDEEVGSWSASDPSTEEATEEESDDDMDDRSMRAHGSDRSVADGQHGLTGASPEPGSGPRHR
jgi:hypothetical protein